MNIRRTLSFFSLVFSQVFYQDVQGDCYLHTPKGSNDRLNAQGQNRHNANRVFDSQNNAKGGYNVPEQGERSDHTKDWYEMKYFMSGASSKAKTTLGIEWTNQHGCGDKDLNCNIVLQHKCQPSSEDNTYERMRNGKTEATPRYPNTRTPKYFSSWSSKDRAKRAAVGKRTVLNEPWEWYDKCAKRQRNKGLFTADQKLKGTTSKYTRQNPKGNRHGYECPEERDYYPYFHPTDWVDIAVLANKVSDCADYKKESFNVKPKGECMQKYKSKRSGHVWRHDSQYNNKADCHRNSGKWVEFSNYLEIANHLSKSSCRGKHLKWAIPYRSENIDKLEEDPRKWAKCLVVPDPPDCIKAPTSRPNHLGNGIRVQALNYQWTIPRFKENHRCVLRIRYNISTNDYDTKKTFASSNQGKKQKSIIVNDPEVSVGKNCDKSIPLQLAINTAQFGRTFEDRSHIFEITSRPKRIENKRIHNLNVRGKRGNIVQVYPAVEYDFTPKRLVIKSTDLVHMQWAGCNTNPGNNDGEGRRGSDRSNIVDMIKPDRSYPIRGGSKMFKNAKLIYELAKNKQAKTPGDIAAAMATAGYFTTENNVPKPFKVQHCNRKQAAQLDCYPASYNGMVVQFRRGIYYYMCSRNNNFTNRSQKGRLMVK